MKERTLFGNLIEFRWAGITIMIFMIYNILRFNIIEEKLHNQHLYIDPLQRSYAVRPNKQLICQHLYPLANAP